MSNNPRHDLSSLSREELMNLIAGQQSQLRSQQQQQQHQQQQQRQNQQLQQQQQQQNFWLGQSSASLLHDRLLLAAPSGLTSANISGLAALLGGGGNASASAATGVSANSGLAELLGLGGVGATSSLLLQGGGGTFHDGNGVGSSQTSAELLQQARARLAAGMSIDPLIDGSSTMRNLLLRHELLGGQLGGAAFASLHSQPQQQHGHGRSGSELPPVGSDEDLLLRNLIASEARGRAVAAAQQELAAAGGGVDLMQHQRSFLLDQAAAQQNPALAGLILRNFGLGSALEGGNATNATVATGIGIGARNGASLNQLSSGVSSADVLRSARSAAQEDGAPREADEEKEEKKVAPSAAGLGKNAKHKRSKRPLSAYNIFFKEEHAKIIAQNEKVKAGKRARGEPVPSDDEYEEDPDAPAGESRKRKRTLSTNQPGKRGKRQVDFENLTKVIGKRWKELPKERVEVYKRQAEEAMQEYRKNLFQKIRNSVKDDQVV